MSLVVMCSSCEASFRVKDEYAGKRGKCPKCAAVVQVPVANRSTPPAASQSPVKERAVKQSPIKRKPVAAASADSPAMDQADRARLQRQILDGFQGEIEPVDIPFSYNFGILLASVVMILLPAIYVGLIGAILYLMYWYVASSEWILGTGRSGRGAISLFLLYLTPLVTGAILVLFMIKPLFAPRGKSEGERTIRPDEEPLLFEFVRRVCAAIGAPEPKEIKVDASVNAGAGLRRGFLSMFGDDLSLVIGLPLVVGLDTRQFAGVLAHEFGHFTQEMGMRLTYVVRSINFWFMRVVYQRDRWDEMLEEGTNRLDIRIGFILHLARFFVGVSRAVLWVLMQIGNAVAGFLMRQMEYDADRHETRLAGSAVFESTGRQITVLNVAYEGARSDLSEFYRDGRLSDDLPRLISVNVDQIPKKILAKVDEHLEEESTGLFDTHPSHKARVANANRESTPGIYRVEQPAAMLFFDFETLSKDVTLRFYREIFGPDFKRSDMHPVEGLLGRQEKRRNAIKAVRRYFQDGLTLLRPLPLDHLQRQASIEPAETVRRVKSARAEMVDGLPAYKELYKICEEIEKEIIEADQVTVLLKARLQLDPADWGPPVTSPSAAMECRKQAVIRRERIRRQMNAFEDTAAGRLFGALQLIYVPAVAARIEDAETWQDEAKRILRAMLLVSRQIDPILELRALNSGLGTLLHNLENNHEHRPLISMIEVQMGLVRKQVMKLHETFSKVHYPFDHAKGQMSIARYALEKLPEKEELVAIYEAADSYLMTLPELYLRMTGRVCLLAEQIEKQLGLEPLEDPPDEEADE